MMDDQTTAARPEPGQVESGSTAVKKTKVRLESVQADVVQLNQSSADLVNAAEVTLRESGARQINGQSINIANSGIGIVHGSNISVTGGALGICSSTTADVSGNVGLMIGQSVTLDNHRTGVVVTREVQGSHIKSILFVAGRSDAPVETILDQRSVALFGLAAGVAVGMVLSLFRLLKR